MFSNFNVVGRYDDNVNFDDFTANQTGFRKPIFNSSRQVHSQIWGCPKFVARTIPPQSSRRKQNFVHENRLHPMCLRNEIYIAAITTLCIVRFLHGYVFEQPTNETGRGRGRRARIELVDVIVCFEESPRRVSGMTTGPRKQELVATCTTSGVSDPYQ